MCGCVMEHGHSDRNCPCSCHETTKPAFSAGAMPPPTVLEEAGSLIYGDRQQEYGNARDNFSHIAHLWQPIIGKHISAEAVALCLLQLKVARAINDVRNSNPIKRDTIVDLAGYAGCIEKIQKGV